MPEARNSIAIEVSLVNGVFDLSHGWSPPFGTHSADWYELMLPFNSVKYKPVMNLDVKIHVCNDLLQVNCAVTSLNHTENFCFLFTAYIGGNPWKSTWNEVT